MRIFSRVSRNDQSSRANHWWRPMAIHTTALRATPGQKATSAGCHRRGRRTAPVVVSGAVGSISAGSAPVCSVSTDDYPPPQREELAGTAGDRRQAEEL